MSGLSLYETGKRTERKNHRESQKKSEEILTFGTQQGVKGAYLEDKKKHLKKM